MPHVMNALDKTVSVKVFGNWFAFTPKQIKYIANEHVAKKMTEKELAEEGLVSFPDEAMELEKNSPEFKQYVAEASKQGKASRIRKLKEIIYNLEVSLQKDLDVSGLNIKSELLASEGEVSAYRELATFAQFEEDTSSKRSEEIKKLKEKINGSTNVAQSGAANTGHQNNPQSTPTRK